jgi:ankyrin repeat protein
MENWIHVEIIKLLIHKGADISIKGGKYGTALQAACGNNNVPISAVQLLLDKGADVNVRGGKYGNALQAACQAGSTLTDDSGQDRKLEVVQLLLSRGADVRAKGGYFGTALQAACASPSENTITVRLLIGTGAYVNARGGRYGTALQAACAHGSTKVVHLLLEEGALVNAEGGYHGTALQAACAGGHIEVARLLLEHGANIHLRNNGAWHAAARSLNGDLVRLLVDLGVDVNDQHDPHGTALHAVVGSTWGWVLLDNYIHNTNGKLYVDDFSSWTDRIQLLISRGADPNLVAGEYGTALQAACAVELGLSRNSKYADHNAVASEFLLKLCPNVDINVQGGLFGSALQAAAYSGQTSTIGLLLNKGANVNTRGGKYGSALNAAIMGRNWDIVQTLLAAGAVPDCHTMPEPNKEWLQRVLEDKDDGQGAVERYRKFWEVEMASLVEKGKEKA